ncbi:hypothetical protein LNO78_09895 [Klebsiella pneumoniae subsp. pneumoniae]|nr:hypothetical protein [Klebsiella pneumoniae subsp. pneumoniae]
MADNEKLGSTSPQVLLKNAINLDKLVNDRESESLPDRFDVLRRTWFGMEKAHDRQMQSQENRFDTFIASSGYEVIGDYTAGPLTLTEYNQLIRYNNELYKLTAATDIPYTTAGTTDETWNATDSLHFVSVGDAALRQELSFSDGLKMIGECSYLSILRSVEPQFDGQQISLTAGHTGWSANASGMPWGGGKFRYIANLPAELQMDDGGSIIKTVGGKCWVREELLTGIGEIRVEWYLNAAPSFTDDASDAFQAAADTAKLWAQYSGRNSTVRLVMPPKMYITKTINVYSRGVRIDGNHGYCQVSASGTYTAYNTLSTNANITASPDGGATVVAVINLTHGAGGPGVANPAYSDQELVKDWNLTLGARGLGIM